MSSRMLSFTKMHGIGNDYVYVNGFEETVDDPPRLARKIADRHFGVGADGLILLLPPVAPGDADARMRMFNADGSEAEMCGNGIRCVCKLTHDLGISANNPMRIQTDNGVLLLAYTVGEDGKVAEVSVDMGEPVLDPRRIPVALQGVERVINHPPQGLFDWASVGDDRWAKASGLDERMTCVSMGNPHAIFFCSDVTAVPLASLGPLIEEHRIFPQRINVHFAEVRARDEIIVRTWERGSGITMACGTGASAVCVAGALTDRSDRKIVTHLDGGDLRLQWQTDNNHVIMTGPAEEVFRGEWPLDTKNKN